MMDPTFKTARLNVFEVEILPTDNHEPRLVYLGVRHDIDCPMVIATATVWWGMRWLEMVEVNDLHRRQGIGLEFLNGIEEHLATDLHKNAVSEAGEALLAALDKAAALESATKASGVTIEAAESKDHGDPPECGRCGRACDGDECFVCGWKAAHAAEGGRDG